MIARLIKIAFFTGAAHLFTLITLKILSQRIDETQLSLIGELDSLTQFIISMIAFGLQLSAVRDIAITENWKSVFHRTQSSRTALGIVLMLLALLYFINPVYGYFLFAPVFALSGDYALYGRGRPVSASIMAFFRVFIPSLILIVCSFYFPASLIAAYVVATVFIYFFTSIIISKWLDIPYLHKPFFPSLIEYVKSINLGIVTLSYYFLGLGLLIFAALLFSDAVNAVAYLGLKLYVIYKGVLRIINQAFIREMIHDVVGFKVDQISITAGLFFAAIVIIFPVSFILLFFNEQYLQYKEFLIFIGVSGFIFSLSSSLTTRSMLLHKDRRYAQLSMVAMLVSCALMVILSFYFQNPVSIGCALLAGELITTTGLFLMNRDIDIKNRIVFLSRLVCALLIPVALRIFGGDDFTTLTAGMLVFAGIAAYFLYQQFIKLPTIKEKSFGQP